MTIIRTDTVQNSSLEDIQDEKKVVCSKCGGRLRLKEASVWDISEDGTYEWEKPVYSECDMSCIVCGYSPVFENNLGKVTLDDDDDGHECREQPIMLMADKNSKIDLVKSFPMFEGILDEVRTIADIDELELSEMELERIAARILCNDVFSEAFTLLVRETFKGSFTSGVLGEN